jgi:hypothetical protein
MLAKETIKWARCEASTPVPAKSSLGSVMLCTMRLQPLTCRGSKTQSYEGTICVGRLLGYNGKHLRIYYANRIGPVSGSLKGLSLRNP